MELRVVWHYDSYDKDFCGDYWGIEVFHNGERVRIWGDCYHDSGREKLEGFLDGIEFATGEYPNVTIVRVADGQSYTLFRQRRK